VLNITIEFDSKGISQEDAGIIIRNPMAGTKYFLPIGRDVYSIISVPPGYILEFDTRFYEKRKAFRIAYELIANGWDLERINLKYLKECVILVIEKNDCEMIHILEKFVNKQIDKIFNSYPTQKDIPPDSDKQWELDDLINLQTLLQNKDSMRPALLGIYKFTGTAPIEI